MFQKIAVAEKLDRLLDQVRMKRKVKTVLPGRQNVKIIRPENIDDLIERLPERSVDAHQNERTRPDLNLDPGRVVVRKVRRDENIVVFFKTKTMLIDRVVRSVILQIE